MSKIESCNKIVGILCKLHNFTPNDEQREHLFDVCYLQPYQDLVATILKFKKS